MPNDTPPAAEAATLTPAPKGAAPHTYPLRCEPAPWEGEPDAGWTISAGADIRCRQVKASEISASCPLDGIAEAIDEALHEGALSEAWGAYGDEMVSMRPGAEDAFAKWLDQWVEVRAYINEGSEPEASPSLADEIARGCAAFSDGCEP